MASAPVAQVGFIFRDRDTNEAKASMYVLWDVTSADAYAWALGAATRLQALSNARIARIDITWRFELDDPGEPATDSDSQRRLLLLIGEQERINAITIPSPRADIFEPTGAYAGIRIDLLNPAIISMADLLEQVELRTSSGALLGSTLLTGGLQL